MKRRPKKLQLSIETLVKVKATEVSAGGDILTVDTPTCDRAVTCVACG